MIFVTVGTQLPFERLIKTVDQWAGKNPQVKIFGQIGETVYQPTNFEYAIRLSPNEYEQKLNASKVIIGHVGMGTIITGIEKNKSLVLMPRHASKGEHRNDHQISTANRFKQLKSIDIVEDEDDLAEVLEARLFAGGGGSALSGPAPELLKTIASFVGNGI